MSALVTIASADLTATIAPLGAELQSLTDEGGRDYLWRGDPAWWSGRAPLLFPVVGRLNGDSLRLGDRRYPMPQHGFARRQVFELVEHGADRALLRLRDDAVTRAVYPYAFELDMAFAIEGVSLAMEATVRNTGTVPLPASFGFHPAFVWPLPGAPSKAAHAIVFERDEPGMLRAVTSDALVGKAERPSPVRERTLSLDDALFAEDALVWTELASRALRYRSEGRTALDIAFPDTPHLGIWTKPGARFVCIEPWAGYADPPGFEGDFRDKPGVFVIAPGGERRFQMSIAIAE